MNFKLVTALIKKGGFDGPAAHCLAWRIENEYPLELKSAAEMWARDEKPQVNINGCSLDDFLLLTGGNVPKALDMMYIYGKDKQGCKEIMSYCSSRDTLK